MGGSIPKAETITERTQRVGGFTSGFDYLRIGLAVGVVLEHSLVVSDQALTVSLWLSWPRAFMATILPCFFALSGFLVTGSLMRQRSLAAFIALRGARLLPALAVEVLLSAFILGPLLTDVPLAAYFSSADFWRYFLNIVGDVQYVLPGMFGHNPFPNVVNQSIWTIPYELDCYLWLVGLSAFGIVRHRKLFTLTTLVLAILGTMWAVSRYQPEWQQNPVSGKALVVAFLAGAVLQLYANRVRLDGRIALVSLGVGMLLLLDLRLSFLAVFPLAYSTVWAGLTSPPRIRLLLSGDYSYGLYLFAFPIQQAEITLLPGLGFWGYNAAIALVCGLAYAALSWWFIEAPILAQKQAIASWAEAFAAFIGKRLFGKGVAGRARGL